MLAAVPTGMSAAFREISTLTLPDSAVDAAIAPHNYTGNVSRICGGLMRARSEGQLRIVVLGTSMAAAPGHRRLLAQRPADALPLREQ